MEEVFVGFFFVTRLYVKYLSWRACSWSGGNQTEISPPLRRIMGDSIDGSPETPQYNLTVMSTRGVIGELLDTIGRPWCRETEASRAVLSAWWSAKNSWRDWGKKVGRNLRPAFHLKMCDKIDRFPMQASRHKVRFRYFSAMFRVADCFGWRSGIFDRGEICGYGQNCPRFLPENIVKNEPGRHAHWDEFRPSPDSFIPAIDVFVN